MVGPQLSDGNSVKPFPETMIIIIWLDFDAEFLVQIHNNQSHKLQCRKVIAKMFYNIGTTLKIQIRNRVILSEVVMELNPS